MIIVNAVLVKSSGTGIEDPDNELLGIMTIANDGTGTETRRNYDVAVYSRGKTPRKVREARIENWPANSKTAMALVAHAFQQLGYE